MQRVVFNDEWQEVRREALFEDLRQRIRDVEQDPDGLLYVLTDERDGAVLKLEPDRTVALHATARITADDSFDARFLEAQHLDAR